MSWTLRVLFTLLGALLLMPSDAQASRENPECECESSHWATVDAIWAGEAVEEVVFEIAACEELRVYRNAVYARHGFNFTNDWVKGWFTEHEPRWTPIESISSETVGDQLSETDLATVQAVKKWEEQYQCDAYWEQRSEASAEVVEEEAPPPEPEYILVPIQSVPVIGGEEGETVALVSVIADPSFVITQAFNNAPVESAWLEPFTCRDLDIVTEAVQARTNKPSSRDELTLLRVQRERRAKSCDSDTSG